MKKIEYIENGLNEISNMDILEKFDLLISSVNAIWNQGQRSPKLVDDLIKHMKNLRYEMSYTKGVEAVSSRLDKVLAYEILGLSRISKNNKVLIDAINDVLYYEINEGFRKELISELEHLS